jgi:hypothetical protein
MYEYFDRRHADHVAPSIRKRVGTNFAKRQSLTDSGQLLRKEGSRVVSAADPYGSILGFLDRSHYFFQAAPQLYSWGWVDTVLHPLLLRKSGSARNWTWAPGSLTTLTTRAQRQSQCNIHRVITVSETDFCCSTWTNKIPSQRFVIPFLQISLHLTFCCPLLLLVYLMALPWTQDYIASYDWMAVNNKLERMWTEAAMI